MPPKNGNGKGNGKGKGSGKTGLPLSVIVLNKMGFGPKPGDIDEFDSLSKSEKKRLNNYIDQQTNPDSIDDSQLDSVISDFTGAGYLTTINKTRTELWQEHVRASMGSDQVQPVRDLELLTLIKAVHSKKQLVEVLADFWHSHFSIYFGGSPERSMSIHYDRDVIRPHVLGNYRDMLEAVSKSTSMLYYLDNYNNRVGGPNENWSRELLELMAMGTDNYFGSIPPEDVPGYPNSLGYVENDVIEVTRCFTGWTVANYTSRGNTGEFYYQESWHDTEAKTVLGQQIPAGQAALQDGLDVINILANHEKVAEFISYKLCRRLISDNPPSDVVSDAASTFLSNAGSPEQLKLVVETILKHNAFKTSWGGKFKRGFEFTASSLRTLGADFSLLLDESWLNSFINSYRLIGQQLFHWKPPNGWPDVAGAWQNSNSYVMRWRLANWLIDSKIGDFLAIDVIGQAPQIEQSSVEIVDFWLSEIIGYTGIDEAGRQEMINFMADGGDPDALLDFPGNSDVRNRVRSLIALIHMSPEFQMK